MSTRSQSAPKVDPQTSAAFTEKQGQYLAFIQLYQQLHRIAPAEADFQAYFGTTPPSVHRMVVALERKGLIARKPRTPRSIKLLVSPESIPPLEPIKTSETDN